ncbi:MAG: hypothetical protein Q8P89_02860 [bacterium]|nr:hypothetical protein [bacterium]
MNLVEAALKTEEQTQIWRVNRRGFLALAGTGLLTVGGLAFYTPEKPAVPNKTDKVIYPGWIEGKIKSPFIRLNEGHFHWMREAIHVHPLLFDSTCDFFAYLGENLEAGRRLELGDMLSRSIGITAQRLKEVDSSKFDPKANPNLELVHAGLFPFAAALNTWFSADDLRKFGVPLKDSPHPVAEYFWGRNGLGARVLPGLFGVDDGFPGGEITEYSEPSQTGQDRTVHFAQHLLITFAYLYSKHYDLGEHQSIPSILRVPIAIAGGNSPSKEARIFSNWVGRFYEFSVLLRPESWPVPGIRKLSEIPDGPFDEMVEADYKGNRLGALTAVALWNRVLSGESIGPVLQELNDERFHHFETEPHLNSL